MKNKSVKKQAILIFILSFFLCGLLSPADAGPVKTFLQKVEDEIETALKQWQFSVDGKSWQKHWLHTTVDQPHFWLRASVRGAEHFAGVRVKGTPLVLRLKLYARGLCEVTVKVNDQEVETFAMDGSSGTGPEELKEIAIANLAAAKTYPVTLEIKNKGFKPFRTEYWPPRSQSLEEEGLGFRIIWAEAVYPQAQEMLQEVQNWLLSMKTADTLVNPEFRRFTFTGKPYEIPDKRKTPGERLEELNGALKKAVLIFSLDALKKGKTDTLKASLQDSYRIAESLREYAREFKVYLIGNAHIDIAWLWRIAETVLVARNTYDTVIQNMAEYPELRYAQSQALTYQWIETRYPELFQKIKLAFKQGKWEIVGGMWVEPDCNLISGESWVRQLLYGKNYFQEKFGIDVRTGWNVDSFGYNWNMPQIYRKSGIDRFVTQKIWWNDTTVFPFYIFWWQGVDGTKLLSYFPPVGYTSRVELDKVADNITKYEATTGYKKSLILYGMGDHGGGPNREILDRVRGYGKLHIAPEFIHSPARPFLEGIEADLGKDIPVWQDELYLEYHRGTYTTQAKVKQGNRKSESRILSAEKLASIAGMIRGTYPQGKLEEAWKLILTNQFHDILPGSSITPVYPDALEFYKKAAEKIKKVEKGALESIAEKVDTWRIKNGTPLLVFNPLSWQRSDFVTLLYPVQSGRDLKILDTQGRGVPFEIEEDDQEQFLRISFIARDIPALGCRVFTIVEGKPVNDVSDLVVKGYTMENKFYRLEINPNTGNIKSLYDKVLEREFVQEGKEANVLQVYEDRPERWDAWNIGYTGRMWELDRADAVEIVKNSPLRLVMRVKKSFLGLSKSRYSPTEDFPSSFFTQYITLYRNLDRIDIKTEADWWEDHMFLKAAFPVNVKSDFATYEIPFAAIKRTTKLDSLWEKARFEVSALNWADLSGKDCGISLLNDCKYGYDIHEGVMKISLLRAPTWPDPLADRGKHTFTYSLYTHKGGWDEADTVKRGHELNSPLVCYLTDRHRGIFPAEFSFFSLQSAGVILETIKKEERGQGFILRLYESKGMVDQAVLTLFKAPLQVYETDLMENPVGALDFQGKTIPLDFKKFEIKTLLVRFAHE